jgi:hypothetical protein
VIDAPGLAVDDEVVDVADLAIARADVVDREAGADARSSPRVRTRRHWDESNNCASSDNGVQHIVILAKYRAGAGAMRTTLHIATLVSPTLAAPRTERRLLWLVTECDSHVRRTPQEIRSARRLCRCTR